MNFETDSKTVPGPYQNEPRLERDSHGVWHVRGYQEARDLLREELIQNGFGAEMIHKTGFEGVLYMHGDPHRQMRAAIAKYFSPTTVQNQHLPLIERTADELMQTLKKQKRIDLKVLSRNMATVIATAVIGLNPTPGLIRRLDAMLHAPKPSSNRWIAWLQGYMSHYYQLGFFLLDVMPAIRQRRRQPQNDVISYMLSKNKTPGDILVECLIYGAAGMATTQEFICVVLLHCMRDPKLRDVLSSEDTKARYDALNEILRLEPVIANIHRKAHEPVTVTTEGQEVTIPPGERIAVHIYDVNVDEKAVGEQPTCLDPERELEKGVYRSGLGFGSGPHRCAGEHLALAETDVFIRKLLELPGLRIEAGPDIFRNETVEGYEISNLIVAVD